jgi:hypothetical protein
MVQMPMALRLAGAEGELNGGRRAICKEPGYVKRPARGVEQVQCETVAWIVRPVVSLRRLYRRARTPTSISHPISPLGRAMEWRMSAKAGVWLQTEIVTGDTTDTW